VARPEPTIAIVGETGALGGEALAWLLRSGGNRVIGPFSDVAGLTAATGEGGLAPQAIVVAAGGGAGGQRVVVEARRAYPEQRILLLCESVSAAVVGCVIEQHVDGLILHSDGAEQVARALRHVLEGRSVMPAGWHAASLEPSGALGVLSPREREVLELVAAGFSNREIAERLVISCNTVKFHLRTIYTTLGVRSRLQATQLLSL
jgi:two-component system nitrate/nitrite response regulator NarL